MEVRVVEPAVVASAAIETRSLRKVYRTPPPGMAPRGKAAGPVEIVALDALDLQVRAGELLGLLGPNGAGKTTTIGILTTRVKATSGALALARGHPGVLRAETRGNVLSAYAERPGEVLDQLMRGLEGSGRVVHDIHLAPPSLETLFISMTGRKPRR